MKARAFIASHLHRLSDATIEVESGRTTHDSLVQVAGRLSRQPYDYYKLLSTMLGDKACHPLSARECSRVNVANE